MKFCILLLENKPSVSLHLWIDFYLFVLYKAAKAALINFYETLRFEVKDEVGITIATHGWMGTEMGRGRFMVEQGAEMQWKEEREVSFLHLIIHFHNAILH